jgi:hypothetical protein
VSDCLVLSRLRSRRPGQAVNQNQRTEKTIRVAFEQSIPYNAYSWPDRDPKPVVFFEREQWWVRCTDAEGTVHAFAVIDTVPLAFREVLP